MIMLKLTIKNIDQLDIVNEWNVYFLSLFLLMQYKNLSFYNVSLFWFESFNECDKCTFFNLFEHFLYFIIKSLKLKTVISYLLFYTVFIQSHI